MARKESSQSQQSSPDPVSIGLDLWARLARDHADRVNAWWAELAELEGRAYQRAREAFDEAASLSRESLAYLAELSAAWRRVIADLDGRAARA